MTDRLILFLDFDGTLHPAWEFFDDTAGRTSARRYEGPWLTAAPLLAALLKPYGDRVDIVIASWWAYSRPLQEIRGLLPPALAERVIDSIWLQELINSSWSEYHSLQANRHACIRLWLKRRRPGYEGPWFALDDDAQSWPEADRPHLVHAAGTLAAPAVQQDLARRLVTTMGDTVPESTLLAILAVLERVQTLAGADVDRAVQWYQTQVLDELGPHTAEQLVAAGHEHAVLRYLNSLAAGACG